MIRDVGQHCWWRNLGHARYELEGNKKISRLEVGYKVCVREGEGDRHPGEETHLCVLRKILSVC